LTQAKDLRVADYYNELFFLFFFAEVKEIRNASFCYLLEEEKKRNIK